jgi:pimeloyl-ACP methyl ester carboxylesterase
MATFAHDGVDIYYETKGSGRPLMLVAGFAADNAFWMPSLEALGKRYQVITPDNRGAGRTTPLDTATGIEQMAADCMALATHLGHSTIAMAGHSMGGMIVQHCAAHHPERVDRAILAATAPVASPRNNDLFATWVTLFATIDRPLWFRNLFYWVLSPQFFAQPRSIDALVQLAAMYPYQQTQAALARQVEAIAQFDSRKDLSSIRARTLVLAGTLDLLFPIAEAEEFAKSIPHASFAAIEGAAHSFPIEAPQAFTQRVLDFLG